MPTVPTYGPPKVQRQGAPNVRWQARPTAESEGALQGQALAELGGSMARVGLTLADRVFQEQRDRADFVAMMTATRQLGELEQNLLTAPDKGVLSTVRGKDVLEVRDKTLETFDITSGEIEKHLTNDRQRITYARVREQRRQSLIDRVDAHAVTEMAEYEKGEAQASLASAVNMAISVAGEGPPAVWVPRIAEELDRIDLVVDSSKKFLGLRGPAAVAEMKAELKSKLHEGIVTRLIVKDQDQRAQTWYEENAAQIDGPTRARLEEKLQVASTDKEGLTAANEVWARLGPKDDRDPINLDVMEEQLRERFADRPKVFDAARRYLRERNLAVNAGRDQRGDQVLTNLYTAVAEGVTRQQVQRLPAFLAAPPKVQIQVLDAMQRRLEHEANVRYLGEARAAATESREFTRVQRALAQQGIDTWAAYAKYQDPTVLKGMTYGQVLEKAFTELGPENGQRLINDWQALQGSTEAARTVTVDNDMMREVAFANGLDFVYNTPAQRTTAQDAAWGRYVDAVKTEIAREQASTGKPLMFERKKEIAETLAGQRVRTDGWFVNQQAIGVTVDPADRTNAFVYLDEMDANPAVYQRAYTDALTYLRTLPEARGLTDQQLRTRFVTRIQRAVGRAFAGAPRAEVEAALKGQ